MLLVLVLPSNVQRQFNLVRRSNNLCLLASTLGLFGVVQCNLREGKLRKRTAVCRNIVETVLVNLVFLIVRLVIMFEYKKDESIFIVKNGIAIILSMKEIIDLRN